MDERSYIEEVAALLAASTLLTRLGFSREDVITYRTVGNNGWVITKPNWTIPVRGGPRNPYAGVNVHFESRGVGDIRVDCELYPRRQSESKEDRASIQPLLDVKGELTIKLRAAASSRLATYRPDWRRARSNPADPTSVQVMKFNLGLPVDHSPTDFVQHIEPLLQDATQLIDDMINA
jgi:hypothetical protein